MGARPVRSVDRPALDAVRGDVRARRRRRRHAADPLGDRRRGADAHDALAPRQAGPAAVRRSACSSTRSGTARSCPYYGAMFLLAAWLFTLRIRWLRRDRRGRRARRMGDQLVAVRTDPRRTHHEMADLARRLLAPRSRVRRVRQRHPPAPAVAGVLLRGHRARPVCSRRRGGARRRSVAGSRCSRSPTWSTRPHPANEHACSPAPIRSIVGSST